MKTRNTRAKERDQTRQDLWWVFGAPYERCPECGKKVKMPCVLCSLLKPAMATPTTCGLRVSSNS